MTLSRIFKELYGVKERNILLHFTKVVKKRCKTLIINPTFFIEGAKIGVF